MENIKNISEYFLIGLAFGTGLFSILTRPSWTGEGFSKLIQGVCGGSLLISLVVFLTHGDKSGPMAWSYYASLFLIGLSFLIPGKDNSPLNWILFVLKNGVLLYLSFLLMDRNFPSFFFYLASIVFIGSVVYGMLLGHWYLVVPKLSEIPLLKTVKITWGAMLIKSFFSIWGFNKGMDFFLGESSLDLGMSFKWLVLLMRFFWGYVALLILSIFAWKLIRMRSIQSATGILYVMVFFLFVGEIISAYMFYHYGVLI